MIISLSSFLSSRCDKLKRILYYINIYNLASRDFDIKSNERRYEDKSVDKYVHSA